MSNNQDIQFAFDYFKKGNKLFESHRYNEAINYYDKAIVLIPDKSNFIADKILMFVNKAKALVLIEKYNEAIKECYDKIIKLNPNNKKAHYEKGINLLKLNKYEETILCMNKVIEIDPKYSIAYYNLGNALLEIQQYDQAIQNYDRAIELDYIHSNLYYNKGDALSVLEKYREAIDCYNESIKLNPINHYAYVGKGNAFLKLRKYKKALKCYNKAKELDSNDFLVITNIELCLIAIDYRKKKSRNYYNNYCLII